MNAKIITTCIFLSSVALNGCGFKSGLSMPSSEEESPLFISDAEAKMQTSKALTTEQFADQIEVPANGFSDINVTDEIMLDRVFTEASDALILTDPNAVRVMPSSAGVVIDLTDLEKSIEKQRNIQ